MEEKEFAIDGMTCASCARRVEASLNKIDGVEANVNFANERARVSYNPDTTSLDDLASAVAAVGYRAEIEEHDHGSDDLTVRLIVAFVLSLPILLLTMIEPLQFNNWQWLSMLLASFVVFWAAAPIHRATLVNARHGQVTMDTLITIGVLAAYFWSLYALFFTDAGMNGMRMSFQLLPEHGGDSSELYFEVAAMVVSLILLGRWLEERAKQKAGAALEALLTLGAKQVSLLRDGKEELIAADQLQADDLFLVRPGEKIATDGVVVEGEAAIDMSMLSGESLPIEVGPGSEVIGATINTSGRLVVRASRVGEETALWQIIELVRKAQSSKAPVERLADRVSAIFVPIVIVLALLTLAGWLIAGAGANFAFTAAVAVLIIACPCALGLATPTALMAGVGRGAQLGVLIRSAEVLERTRQVDTIVLDKTGTVTQGKMAVSEMRFFADQEEILPLIASLESASEHPVAQAIAAAYDDSGLVVERFVNHQGLGSEGVVAGRRVIIGRLRLLQDKGIHVSEEVVTAQKDMEAAGQTAVLAAIDGQVVAVISVADTIKESSAEAIADFNQLGLKSILLTGDNEITAQAVAESVGIGDVISQVLPEEKAEIVNRLQDDGATVAMVGDGVNDSPALAKADLSLAMGSGSDVAIETADITLVSSDLRSAGDAISLSRATLRVIKENLGWAFGYNVAAIPLAMAGLLNPMIAAAAMAFSSLSVVLNALRLRRFHSKRSQS